MLSRWLGILGGFVLLFAVGSCGRDTGPTRQGGTSPQVDPSAFDISETWVATSKTCNGVSIAPEPHEAYKMDKDRFVRVNRFSETETSLCKMGYVYDRIISSFETTTGKYSEAAVIKGSRAKKTCWKREAGATVGAPVSDEVVEFGPEETHFKLVATIESRTVDLESVKECPGGTLRLVLSRR